ncbi:hypothetical protein [Inconstantimicrobium porci]|uniref:hypothetical protein n=1 Tax=Inconstantimicrobium porci TaxID=2652291 RepID=UPI00240A2533|nr:hypothetical protein [Inconstantimicrobium porci]MDD6769666.1 hypothetical protein [Inconstantimicrobium porci]
MVDIIDKARKSGKLVRIDNSKDYVKLMKLAEHKGYKWFSGAKPINKRYDKEKGLPILIGFYTENGNKYLNFSENMGYAYIYYEYKINNTLW